MIETPHSLDGQVGATPKKRKKSAYLFIKRFSDIVFSLLASVVFLIPMIIIAMIIVIKDPGSPFYVQKRVGKDGKDISILKFRSMRKGADNLEKMLTPEQLELYKREYKLNDDPRLIGYKRPGDGKRCFGARLRQLSLDELMQIPYNILLKGDMAIVGPRPILRDELTENYTLEEQERILSVKPGLTGYWQAYARNGATYEDGKRQEMELFYVENASILWDMKIVLATVWAIVKKTGV